MKRKWRRWWEIVSKDDYCVWWEERQRELLDDDDDERKRVSDDGDDREWGREVNGEKRMVWKWKWGSDDNHGGGESIN